MTRILSRWETTRLSKHFILLDFLADRDVYCSDEPLAFDDIWNDDERNALAEGLCNELLEPLMMDNRFGPITIADAFVPSVLKSEHHMKGHRWTGGEATVDIGLYGLVDDEKRERELREAVLSVKAINACCDHVISYPETEFVCVTFKREGAKRQRARSHIQRKKQNLRAHHVRVGRYFNLLDFCRSGRAVETGVNLVPIHAENNSGRAYCPVREETAARSFAAALDPLVEQLGRVSVVRGMERHKFADDEHAKLHRWDLDGPWRLEFVLPRGADPERARSVLTSCPHVQDVQSSHHPSESWSLALVVDRKEYGKYRGLRPVYPD